MKGTAPANGRSLSTLAEPLRILRPFWPRAVFASIAGSASGIASGTLLAPINRAVHTQGEALFGVVAAFAGLLMRRGSILVLASAIGILASSSGFGDATRPGDPPGMIAERRSNGIRIAQTCGWYVIYMCSRSKYEAENWSYQREAINSYTIYTTRSQYPNFTPEYYCAVDGPMDRTTAITHAKQAQDYGTAPTAYAKNAC